MSYTIYTSSPNPLTKENAAAAAAANPAHMHNPMPVQTVRYALIDCHRTEATPNKQTPIYTPTS